MSLLPGTRLGPYEVLSPVGAGGMGEVYKARDVRLGRDVAVKVLPDEFVRDPERLSRFEQEARAAAAVNHPNILILYDIGTHDDLPYIVTELLEGESLRQRLRSGSISPSKALAFGVQIAHGLSAAHDKGVVHRDLKPENIFITTDGRVKILDFGLARLKPAENDTPVVSMTLTAAVPTREGQVLGTPGYMAPEQVRGLAVDHRVDIFALGCVIYEMLSEQRAFTGPTVADVLSAILKEDPQAPSRVASRVPAACDAIVLRCLEKRAEDRFGSARDVAFALEAVAELASNADLAGSPSRAGQSPEILALTPRGTPGRTPPRLSQRGEARRSVAVLGFKNLLDRPEASWLSTALSEMLTTELSAGEKLRAIPGENVARMRIDLTLPMADSYAPDTLARIRGHLGCDIVVLGSFLALGEKAGGQVRLDIRVQDAIEGTTLASLAEVGTEGDFIGFVSRAGSALRSKLGLAELTDLQARQARAAQPGNADAARIYAEGLMKLRAFDALSAKDLFEEAIAADPSGPMAYAALSSAWSILGYDIKSREAAERAFKLSSDLAREDRLAVEARMRETTHDLDGAIEIYRSLFTFFPDDLEYGLRLAGAQASGSKGKAGLQTIRALRRLKSPLCLDPRIDLAEAQIHESLSDYKACRSATAEAIRKSVMLGAGCLVAKGKFLQSFALGALGEASEAIAAAEDARFLFGEMGDQGGVADALNAIALVQWRQGRLTEAMSIFQEALEIFQRIGKKRGVWACLHNQGLIHYGHGDLGRAREKFEASARTAREIGNRTGEADALNNLGLVLSESGAPEDAERAYQEALRLLREIGNRFGEANVLNNLGLALSERGDFDGAARLHEEARGIFAAGGNRGNVGASLVNLGLALLNQGSVLAAREKEEEAVAVFRETGEQSGLAYALNHLAKVQYELDELPDARRAQEEGLKIRLVHGEAKNAAQSHLDLAAVRLETGDFQAALQETDAASLAFREGGAIEEEVLARCLRAKALLGLDRVSEAITSAQRAEELLATRDHPHLRLAVVLSTALSRAHKGTSREKEEARASLEEALDQCGGASPVPLVLEAELVLAQLAAACGDTAAARARMGELIKRAEALSFRRIVRLASGSPETPTLDG